MLNIILNEQMYKNRELVIVPWDTYFRENKITKYFDTTDTKIVEAVENTSLINNETIGGKFSDMPIGIGCLSEGCKTLLCINHAIKFNLIDRYVFNITSCGGNAVTYLVKEMAKNIDIYVCIEHGDLGLFENATVKIGDRLFDNATIASTYLIDVQGGL